MIYKVVIETESWTDWMKLREIMDDFAMDSPEEKPYAGTDTLTVSISKPVMRNPYYAKFWKRTSKLGEKRETIRDVLGKTTRKNSVGTFKPNRGAK